MGLRSATEIAARERARDDFPELLRYTLPTNLPSGTPEEHALILREKLEAGLAEDEADDYIAFVDNEADRSEYVACYLAEWRKLVRGGR